MPEPPEPRNPIRLPFLIPFWLLLTAGTALCILQLFFKKPWFSLMVPGSVVLFWLGMTGYVLRQVSRESRLARLFPDHIQGQRLDSRVSGKDIVVAALVVAALIVVAWFTLPLRR